MTVLGWDQLENAKTTASSERTERWLSLAVWCGLITAAVSLAVVPHRIWESGYLVHVSGTLGALADDVAHGVLYRPLISELGYGGTRNFPLLFALMGGLEALGLPLLLSGHLCSLLATGLLLYGGTVGLARAGASRKTALCLSMLALASRAAVAGMAGIRGDLLPVGLGVLGLGLAAPGATLPASALALGLSVLAKPTLAWAPAAALLSLWAAGERRAAIQVTLGAAVTVGVGLGASMWASDGNMLTSLRACASGGGFSLSILRGGLSYARPGDLAWILGGLMVTLTRGRAASRQPLAAAVLTCVPATLFVFSSRGTHVNHFIDATAVGALALASAVADPAYRGRAAKYLLPVATALGLFEGVVLDGMLLKHGELQAAAAALPTGADPVLSEQPWIPILAGDRPFLLDAYNLEQMRTRFPEIDRDFLARLDSCRFRAVVLLGILEDSSTWYDTVHFGPGFREHLLSHYEFDRVVGAHALYLPRCHTPRLGKHPAGEETTLARNARPSKLQRVMSMLRGGTP